MGSKFNGVRNIVGRPTGSPNVATAELRKKMNDLIENNLDKMQSDLNELEPKDRLRIIIDMAKFVLPNLKSIDILENDDRSPIIINLGRGTKPE
jgi:hypothetical protein